MNIKITNGKIEADKRRLPKTIEGLDDFLQKAKFMLTVPLGSFIYDSNFGSRIKEEKENQSEERLLAFANEALSHYSQMRAVSVEIKEDLAEIEVETPAGNGIVNVSLT